jgi:hypothetical protein
VTRIAWTALTSITITITAPAVPARAADDALELGLENFYYRTADTALNRGNVLGLDPSQDVLRGSLQYKGSRGPLRAFADGFVERRFGGPGDRTARTLRQAYAQYDWGYGASVRVGKQRVAWGSGFAWNPSNRVEPPKSPFNTSLEQAGTWAARMDWIPASWVGVILVGSGGDTQVGDLPFEAERRTRRTAAVRARFLVKDTDLAVVFSGGRSQRTLFGFDLGRDLLGGRVSAHAEGSVYRGAELPPARDDTLFVRVAAGLLHVAGTTALSCEYFFNGEGYGGRAQQAYLMGLDAASARAQDPRLGAAQRSAALAAYLAAVGVPYSGGLGLRRHYLHAAWTRSEIRGEWTAAVRAVIGLSDGGVALTPGLAYAPRGDLTLHLDAVLLLGPEDSEYRLAPVRGALQARVRALF